MNNLDKKLTLKEISHYKKKLNWGELPILFHMAFTSISDIDNILTHGFDSAFKSLFDTNSWNLDFLGSYRDKQGNVMVKNKPQIALGHIVNEQHYELHCFPIVAGEQIHTMLDKHPQCAFQLWVPETMKMLFRINSLISFMTYSIQDGDEADLALIKFAHFRVEELVRILHESFDIVDIRGYNIAEFYSTIYKEKKQSLQNLSLRQTK